MIFPICRRVGLLFGVLAGWLTAEAEAAERAPKLFQETVASVAAGVPPDFGVKRQRDVVLDAEAWSAIARQPVPARVLLNLFTNAEFTAVLDRRESPGAGRVVHSGRLEGVPGSTVVLASHGDIVVGSVSIPGRDTWRIGFAGNGAHRIVELDPSRRALCGVTDEIVPTQRGKLLAPVEAPPPLLGSGSPISVVDVMVVYTAEARAAAGGTDGMNLLIDAAVMEANTTYAQSLVNVQVRLVHRAEVVYTESGTMQTDLNRVRANNDGFMDNVHTLRDTYGADLVCLVTDTFSSSGGLASQMLTPSASFAPQGFSVVSRSEMVGAFTFAHELGHNMGCAHDRANTTLGGAYSYAYGHTLTVGGYDYGTVMSYLGVRIPHFSNPNVLYRGVPTGIAEGSANSADNARVLNNTAPIVSAFRGTAVSTRSPSVTISSPTQQQRFPAPGSAVTIDVSATDPDGSVARVDFFAGGTLIGSDTIAPFSLLWENVPEGSYELIARATDNLGVAGDSVPVYIIVGAAAPVNDNFAGRLPLTGASSEVAGSTVNATRELNEPRHPEYGSGKSIWYSWTAPASGQVTFNGFGKVVSVFSGTVLTALTNLGYASTDLSSVAFAAVQGVTYQVAVSELYSGTQGTSTFLRWNLRTPPTNDLFANRILIAPAGGTITAYNQGATKEAGEPNHAYPGGASVWWKWTAPLAVVTTIQATGTGLFQPLLGVYTGSSVNALTLIGSGGVFTQSKVMFTATAGTTYQIAIDGLNGETGDFTFVVDQGQPPPNNNFANSVTLTGSTPSDTGTNLRATQESGETPPTYGSGRTVWWKWTSPGYGPTTIDTIGSSFDTILGVYTNTTLANLTLIGTDDQSGGNNTSLVTFNAVRGATYHIVVDGYSSSVGSIALKVNGPVATVPPLLSGLVSQPTTGFQLQIPGGIGQPYVVQWSTNLKTWNDHSSGVILSSPALFEDGAALDYARRFYRVIFP